MQQMQNRFGLFFKMPSTEKLVSTIKKDTLEIFVECKSPTFLCFHPELGWWHKPGRAGNIGYGPITTDDSGSRIIPGQTGPLLMATYGDSFTYGEEVDDNSTWQAQFALAQKIKVQNYGMMGYGPDQAILSYETKIKQGPKIPIVVLSMVRENIYRTMSTLRTFYTYPKIETPIRFKPFLVPYFDEYQFKNLIPKNPLALEEIKIAIESSKPFDSFYLFRKDTNSFPYTASAVGFLARHGIQPTYYWNELTKEASRRTAWLLNRFIEKSKTNHSIPVLMLLPQNQEHMDRGETLGFSDALNYLDQNARRELVVIDMAKESKQYFREGNQNKEYLPFFQSTHPSSKGNRLIAKMLHRALCRSQQIHSLETKYYNALCSR